MYRVELSQVDQNSVCYGDVYSRFHQNNGLVAGVYDERNQRFHTLKPRKMSSVLRPSNTVKVYGWKIM